MDFTSLWVFWQKYRSWAGTALLCILCFALGWQLSRMSSPYAQATPIVFEEIKGNNIPDNTVSALNDLKDQGVAMRKPTTPVAAAASPGPTVAGVTTQAKGSYVASKNSTLYHHVSCATAKRIAVANQRWFNTPEEAQKAGFTPSQCAQAYLKKIQ